MTTYDFEILARDRQRELLADARSGRGRIARVAAAVRARALALAS